MESTKLAELIAAQYSANRAQLQTHQAFIDCQLAAMNSQVAVESTRLAAIRCQQEQIKLAISLLPPLNPL
ncbi:MAG: hypothetical protein NW224_30705 [Leptolyngbyaceae cyanobacterium bins.302]|nr:hypothetical protein [Leptolyngbyaceae cyanobacterium bins.302]